MPCRVDILIVDGFADSGLSIALDVLRTANAVVAYQDKPRPFEVQVRSPSGGPVRAASGMMLSHTQAPGPAGADVTLLPGIWTERPQDLALLLARPDVQQVVQAAAEAYKQGGIVASACGGAFLLAEAGLLNGRRATTTWWLADELARRYPRVKVDVQAALVVGRRVVTAGAVFAQADVVLHLVARFAGPDVARRCANLLLLDGHGSQAPYMAAQHLRANDPVVEQAERWVRAHLADGFGVATLAQRLGVSQRTLSRRLQGALGLSPIAFIQRLRVETAVQLVTTTALSLDEISRRVGYGNASTLSRLIRRETRASAQELRRRGQTLVAGRH